MHLFYFLLLRKLTQRDRRGKKVVDQKQKAWRGAVEQIRRALTAKGRQQLNCFSIEGIRLHERALRSAQPFILTVASTSFWEDTAERHTNLKTEIEAACHSLSIVPDEVMADLTNGRSLGGIISLIQKPDPPELASLVTAVSNPTVLVAQGIVDPGNIGAMIRTAHANDVTAFVVNEGSDPYHPKAVRTSMGSIFKLPILLHPSLADLLSELKTLTLDTVGAVATNGTPLPQATFSPTGTAVFMGNEYFGLPNELISQLDKQITIPMSSGIDSMSVNAATAVLLYELNQQNSAYK